MTEPRMCCSCSAPTIDCDTPDICVRVTFAGVELLTQFSDTGEDAFMLFGSTGGGDPLCGTYETLAGVNGTHQAEGTISGGTGVVVGDGLNPVFLLERCGCSAAPSSDATCDSLGLSTKVARTMKVQVGLECDAGVLRVVSILAVAGGDDPADEALGTVFAWSRAGLDPGVLPGVAVPNQTDTTDPSPGFSGTAGAGGTATVEILVDAACENPTQYAIAEACDTPGQTIVVDLATNTEDKAGLLHQGDLYFLTPDTAPATPVAVTWVDDYCPEPIVSDWYIATRCPPPGRLNGTWPAQVRYFSPSGPNLDDAIFLNLDGSPRPGCVTSLRYEPTDIPTTDPLPIGIRYDGVTPCNGTDIRVCTGDEPDDPQDVCYLCINVGPSSPQWLQDYCAEFCSPALTAPEDGRVAGGVMGTKATGVKRADARSIRTRQSKAARPARRARIWTKTRMIAEYALAQASGRNANAETIALRQLSCFGDELAGVPRCPSLVQTRAGAWCGACGCGARREARLDADPDTGHSKLEFTRLTCPRGRPGFSNHDPGETPEAGIREG